MAKWKSCNCSSEVHTDPFIPFLDLGGVDVSEASLEIEDEGNGVDSTLTAGLVGVRGMLRGSI